MNIWAIQFLIFVTSSSVSASARNDKYGEVLEGLINAQLVSEKLILAPSMVITLYSLINLFFISSTILFLASSAQGNFISGVIEVCGISLIICDTAFSCEEIRLKNLAAE